ncbi:MAG: TOBE domain-containing protein [Helicobacteraceae bacterium]|jgi:molybdate transport system regulatory protein|nr:TOBE domain-containing protein [Helicobacteraceae bacterium]
MTVGGKVWLDRDKERLLGENRAALLNAIDAHGSINKAAKALKIGYKTAWDLVDAMNNLAPQTLVERVRGGKGGGGAKLTRAGRSLVRLFELLQAKHSQLLTLLSQNGDDDVSLLRTAQRITMKTSARNQLAGTVSEIKRGAVNAEIKLLARGKTPIIATITNESLDDMGLKTGDEAYALIKASWIVLSRDKPKAISARNSIEGTVETIVEGKVNVEIKLAIEGGNTIAAVITEDAQKELNFQRGDKAWALFKASHVIIGA